MAVTWAKPSTVIGAAGLDGVVPCPEDLIGPAEDWMGEGVGLIAADLAGGAACASEETDRTVPVIRSENPRRMSFLPVWSFESKSYSLHI
jgi:hypothetical protein